MAGTPVIRKDDHNTSAPGANTDIYTDAITPGAGKSTWIIGVSLSTSSVFNITVTRSSVTHVISLNAAAALTANAHYTFTLPVSAANTYNFQVATDSVIEVLQILEISDAVA